MIVVEDGTGLVNSVSYCSVSFADSYFTERGNIAWIGSDSIKESALIRATDYIELVYSNRFAGTRLTLTQALSFPRQIGGAVVALPLNIQKANCELALIALTQPLISNPSPTGTGFPIKRLRTEVGPIKEDTEWETNVSQVKFDIYPFAELYLFDYVIRSSKVIRA